MTKTGKWTLDAKTGKWREGQAQPRLEPEHIRSKPGEIVTKEIEEGDKIHEEDPPHVMESIVEDWKAQDKPKPKMDPGRMATLMKLSLLHADRRTRLADLSENRRQIEIDIVRMRVLFTLIDTLNKQCDAGEVPDIGVRHLWFPTGNLGRYELRAGPAPRRALRPKVLRDMKLEIDLESPPQGGMDLLEEAGVYVDWPQLKRSKARLGR